MNKPKHHTVNHSMFLLTPPPTQQLWTLVVEEADLIGQLRVAKEFFLLGRGEMFQEFIDQAQILLGGIPTTTTEHGRWC